MSSTDQPLPASAGRTPAEPVDTGRERSTQPDVRAGSSGREREPHSVALGANAVDATLVGGSVAAGFEGFGTPSRPPPPDPVGRRSQTTSTVGLWWTSGWRRPPGRPWLQEARGHDVSLKGVTALAAHICIDRGLLDLDVSAARYWPEFAASGKDGVLVRHVFSHTSGRVRRHQVLHA